MSERNIVEMVELLRKERRNSAVNSELMLAEIETISPLVLRTRDSSISKNIYLNPSYLLEVSEGEEGMNHLFATDVIPSVCMEFLIEFHKNFVLKQGDTVIVLQDALSFYVLERVVKVS